MRPLEGIKILDLSRLLPGPFATLVLSDMGAAVDKVEDPSGGDYLRHMPPQQEGTSTMFLALNRGKRSISLDLKKPAGVEAFLRLVAGYDVVLDQFRPGVLARLGVGHDVLLAKYPRLVVCALTGYGQTGPLAQRAGHDLNYLARGGVLGFQGPKEGVPAVPGFQLADISGALYAVIGILGALRKRDQSGQGSVVDIAMADAALTFALSGYGTAFAGETPRRGDEPLIGGIAPYRTYATKDGRHVALAALEPKFWLGFCAAVGMETDMGALMPGPHQAELMARLEGLFAERTLTEWVSLAEKGDFCLEPVLTPQEAMADAHLRGRGVFFEMPSPWGNLHQLRTPVTPTGAEGFAPPPRQGEHGEAILRDAGFSDAEMQALFASGAARK